MRRPQFALFSGLFLFACLATCIVTSLAAAQESGGSFGGGGFGGSDVGSSSGGSSSHAGGSSIDASSMIDLAVMLFRWLPPRYSLPLIGLIAAVWLISALRRNHSKKTDDSDSDHNS